MKSARNQGLQLCRTNTESVEWGLLKFLLNFCVRLLGKLLLRKLPCWLLLNMKQFAEVIYTTFFFMDALANWCVMFVDLKNLHRLADQKSYWNTTLNKQQFRQNVRLKNVILLRFSWSKNFLDQQEPFFAAFGKKNPILCVLKRKIWKLVFEFYF